MADDERQGSEETEPSLELPSLGSVFRRRRRKPAARTPPLASPASPPPRRRARIGLRLPRLPRLRRLPRLPGAVAALLTGLVVGLALVGLTAGGLRTCSALRGTPSCGNPGFLLLLAITVVVIVLGSLILRVTGVDSHGSTSFLGVGLLVVLILVALLPELGDWWVNLVVPALAMATFALAWWLTTTYVEPGERPR